LSFCPRFQKKSAAGFPWQRISILFDYKFWLFHNQASYGEVNYDDDDAAADNYIYHDNRVHSAIPAG